MAGSHSTRRKLLDAAGRLFCERGYHAVGVQEICRAAAVNKGSFYHFFPSKQQLVIEAIEARADHDRRLIEAALSGSDPPLEKLARLFEYLGRDQAAVPASADSAPPSVNGGFLGRIAAESGQRDQSIRSAVQQAWEGLAAAIEPVINAAMESGALPVGEPRRTAEALLAYIEGVLLFARTRQSTEPITRLGSLPLEIWRQQIRRAPQRDSAHKPRVRLIRPHRPAR